MSLSHRIRIWLRELREAPLRNLGRGERAVRYLYDLVRHCARELRRNRADQMAAALTYRTLFSLLPTLALALVVLQVFVGPEEQDQFKQTVVNWVLTPLRAEPADGQPALGDEYAEILPADAARVEFAEAQHALEGRFEQIAKALAQIDFRSIGLVGLLLFLYAATSLLNTIERSFDDIYGARRKRPWLRRVPLYYTVVTIGPLIMLTGLYLRGTLIDLLDAGALTSWLGGLLAYLSPLLTAWLVLFVMFITIPNARVKVRAAALGALTAALLVGIASQLFSAYVANAGIASLYGALALLPLFLFWLYILWLLVLFGLEVSYALQTVHDQNWAEAEQQAARTVEDIWAVPVALHIARGFERGEASQAEDLAQRLDLPPLAVRRLIDKLETAGIVREVAETERRAYSLARPAHSIAMDRLLEAARPDTRFNEDEEATPAALREFLAAVNDASLEQARTRTLADFVGTDWPDAEAESGPTSEERGEALAQPTPSSLLNPNWGRNEPQSHRGHRENLALLRVLCDSVVYFVLLEDAPTESD